MDTNRIYAVFVFILFIVIVCMCVFFAYWGSKYDLKPLLYLLILFLACITGFRGYEVGIDTTNYIKIWDNMLVGTPVYIELGFQWLICYLQKITANPTILFFYLFVNYVFLFCSSFMGF